MLPIPKTSLRYQIAIGKECQRRQANDGD